MGGEGRGAMRNGGGGEGHGKPLCTPDLSGLRDTPPHPPHWDRLLGWALPPWQPFSFMYKATQNRCFRQRETVQRILLGNWPQVPPERTGLANRVFAVVSELLSAEKMRRVTAREAAAAVAGEWLFTRKTTNTRRHRPDSSDGGAQGGLRSEPRSDQLLAVPAGKEPGAGPRRCRGGHRRSPPPLRLRLLHRGPGPGPGGTLSPDQGPRGARIRPSWTPAGRQAPVRTASRTWEAQSLPSGSSGRGRGEGAATAHAGEGDEVGDGGCGLGRCGTENMAAGMGSAGRRPSCHVSESPAHGHPPRGETRSPRRRPASPESRRGPESGVVCPRYTVFGSRARLAS